MSTRQVILDGGSPWGFRMHGGADVQQPLRISRVNPGSKAAQRGIREGDFISSINGQTTRGVSNAEAHALLRNAGNTLTLGLNQESTGSPKRRAQKLAQEAKEDILKRSSITSTSSSLVSNFSTTNIISNTIPSNESFYSNGVSNHKRTSDESLSHAASNYSPYVKNSATSATSRGASDEEDDVHSRDNTVTDCNHINSTTRPLIITIRPVDSTSNESAVIASTTTATETVDDSVIDCEASSDKQAQILSAVIMADNVHASSRSRKQRRSRTNRKKSKKCTAVTQHNPIEPVGDTDNVVVREVSDCEPLESIVKETYRVESPITVPVEKKTNPMVKSRSLDDEDQVKIMEVTDELQVKSASESIAIVSEAESDVEWETVSDFADEKTLQQIGKLSVISLPLEEQRLFEPSNISPEDERSLRDFLNGLDLVNSAEESVKRIEKPSTSDSAKARKAKKRAALVQHFLPHYQNPRYLDVISEEGSDISDKDSKKNPFARPQYAEDDYDEEDDVFVDVQKKMREKFQSVYADSLEGAILVDTKLLEHDYPMVKEATWSTSIAETRSGAEVVYLEDSSSSMTPSDLLDQEDTVDADDEEDISIDLDKSFSDNFELNTTESASLANTDVSITLSKECAQVKAEPTPPSSVDISANGVEEHPEIDLPSNKTPIDFLQRLSLAYSENSTEANHIMTNDEKGFDMPRNSIDLSNKIDEKMKYLQELINNVNESTTDTLNEINLEEFNSSNLDIEKLINDSELNIESLPEITNGHTEDTSVKDKENKLNDKAENKFEPKELIIQIELQERINDKFEESTKENVKQETIHECIQEFKTTTEERKLNVVDEISNTIKECNRRNNSKEIKTINEEESHKSKEHMIKIELLDEINKIKETNIKQGKLMDEKPCRQQSNKKEHIIKVELEKEIHNENKESKKIINENTSMRETSKKEHIIKVELLDGVSNKMKTNVTEAMDENRVVHKKEQIIKVELLHEDHTIKESNMGKERKLLRSDQNSAKEHIIKVELEDEIGNQMKENIKRNKIQEDSNQIKERIIKVELLDELCNDIKQFNLKSDTVKEKSTDVKLNKASTENDNELNKELKQLCESLLKTRSDEYSNTAEISRPESADSACSSSRSTSQCTAFYNPVHSSLTNIAAMLREGSFDDRVSPDVATLRELCIKTLLSMPFGKDIIEELATVSLSLEEMACQNPSLQSPNIPTKPNTKSPSPLIPVHNKTDDDDSLLVSSTINLPVAPPKMDAETWIGMPTEIDPNVLLCLSPSQKDFIETTKTVPKEADSLLDLHRKYIERRGYHEAYEMFKPTPQKEVRTVQIKIQPRSENKLLKIIQNDNSAQNIINYNNYLKTFTREIPIQVTKSTDAEMKKETNISNGNIRYDTYIKQLTREVPIQVERQIHKPVNNKIYEGAFESEDTKTDRLNARRLSEWLNLSRTGDCADKINNFKEDFNRNCNLQSSVNKLVSQRSCDEHHSHSTMSTVKRSTSPRRYSLPFNLYEQQMQYILEKEREIEREIEKLREEKAKLEKCEDDTVTTEESINNSIPSNKQFDAGKYQISRKGDIAILQDSPTEKFREKMYNEYMCKVAERQERKQNKVIKIKITTKSNEPSTLELSPQCDVKHTTGLEDEFIKKVRERMDKLGLNEESNSDEDKKNGETSCDTEPVLVMDGGSVAAAKKLPKHLQEFVDFTRTTASSDAVARRICRVLSKKNRNSTLIGASLLHEIDSELTIARGFLLYRGVWTPGTSGEAPTPAPRPIKIEFKPPKERSPPKEPEKSDEPAPVVWTPRSAGSSPTAERKEFKPVTFESPVLSRKNKSKETTPVGTPEAGATLQQPPWEGSKVTTAESSHTLQESTVTSTLERRLTTSHSAPTAGLNNLSKLPRAQNPTITLLQRAREGQLPRGASYIEQQTQYQSIPKHRSKDERPPFIGPNEILYTVKNEYMSESDSEKPKKMANLGPRKFEGIGPTTKDGMPIVLRSVYDHQEVKDGNQAKWYKQMYDTLHRAKNDDEYVTVRYKTRRGRYPYTSAGGYLSEPEPNAYDSDAAISASKYATLDRRRLQPNRDKENEYITYTVPRNKYMSASVKHSTDVYKNQPGRIENYIPGHSSISEKEAKEWWDEVMEIFDGWLDDHSALPSLNFMLSQVTARSHLEQQKHVPPQTKSYMSHALKESGYESDSTLVFRRREDAALLLSPHEQKEVYKNIQKGGDVPLHGLRKLAPERPKDDTELEYFPISPTLTRIRIHKNIKPVNEILCYPVTVHHNKPTQMFSTYKRTAPSSSASTIPPPPKLPARPPSPPKRRSSRNSHTLRLISTMTIHTHSPKSTRRHETCFKTTADKSNVKYLRDRISCKLRSPTNSRKGVKVTKTISTYPSTSKESITTSLSKDLKSNKIKSKTEVCCKNDQHYSRSTASSAARKCCRHCSFSVPPKVSDTKSTEKLKQRGVSLERTFGSEKRKVDLTLSKLSSDSRYKLIKSPDLVSPTEVRKGVQKQKDIMNFDEKYPPGTTVKKSTSLFSSAKNGLKSQVNDEKSLNVTVAISARGKEILNPSLLTKATLKSAKSTSPSAYMTRLRTTANSPAPSNISDKSKLSQKSRTASTDSLHSPVLKRKTPSTRPTSVSRLRTSNTSSREELRVNERDKKKTKKTKKDQSNEELKKDKKRVKDNKIKDSTKNKKCHGRAAGTEVVKKLKKMETTEPIPPVIHSQTIEQQHKNIFQSDSFFQHLFLRDMLTSPTPSVASKSSYIIERTKMLQNKSSNPTNTDPTAKALKVYLTNRRPVSESKFKTLDREIMRSRSASPSTLSRSFSEHRNRFDSISEVSNEDSYHDRRTASPDSIRSRRSSSLPATKMIFADTSRSISPCYDQTLVRYRRSSPITSPMRSPSRRKINNIKPPATITVEGVSGLKKKAVRAKSAGEAEAMKREMYYSEKSLTPSVSSVSLSQIADLHEYKTYVTELRHSTRKSDRFKELNSFYSSLERLSQLELTTSSIDLRPRRRHEEEIIDYDRWKQVRTRERAEHEFSALYKKLKQDQREKDLFFHPKDVEAYRWKYDRGLKVKEQSVDNIKEHFEKLKESESPLEISKRRILEYQKDVYKPLWRGNSVLNLVSKISEKRSQSETRAIVPQRRISYTDNMLSREFGTKLWSSLSVEQVNALKSQLAEIYSNAPPKKETDYSINVEPKTKINRSNTLVIRRNSVNEPPTKTKKQTSYIKSSSIGAISNQSLSESEKKRLSLSLSKEVRDKISEKRKYKTSLSIVLGKETRGAIAAADANIRPPAESISPRTCYSLEPTEDDTINKQKHDKDFLLVLTNNESEEEKQNVRQTLAEWSQPKPESTEIAKRISSTSETESASSDTSTKTAIFMGKKENLNKKIEYFERGADVEMYVPTIHRPAEDVIEEISDIIPIEQKTENKKELSNLVTSQSYADLKELFGERELMKFATIPLSATRKQAYTRKPLLRATNISPIRTMSEASSNESLFRSRSMSPESEKFWNAYLALIKGVDVRKLTEKFETLKDFYSNRTASDRRYKSDPELRGEVINMYSDREFGDVYWLRKRYENISRGRSRTRREGKTSPIPKTPLKVEDRLMPHINIISKLASLYPKKTLTNAQKQESVEELAKALGCPVGEVEKLREKFDSPERNVSLLGHMFTSSPNVHELRDIAPYLAGPWIAHQYPRYQDNTRSLSAPEDVREELREQKVMKKDRLRPKSASPSRSHKRPSSILKSHHHARKDIFANQPYDPSIHRPSYRYQPISPRLDRGRTRSWSPIAKHTVTFKEPELGPTPPPKGRIDFKDFGPESPRKYVEDEVTIHYRSPVRHEIKEMISEEELARKQAEAMRRIYQEERRRKYLQELQDMNSRRHTDNFIPSQKSPIPLNRYDDFIDNVSMKMKPRDQSPEPRLVARAIYNFVGQSSRELTFRKGDVIFIRRQVDKNWYEGEHNAMIGLFPSNYVEIVPYDGIKSTPRKAHEGQARAKFNFIAQTHLELSLAKGELVVLTRRVDDNWYEGRIGSRKGIFPVSYIDVLIDPSDKQESIPSSKPVASPAAHSLLLNGSSGGKESMGSHHYQPSYSPQPTTTSYHAKPVNVIGTSSSYHSLTRTQKLTTPSVNEALHIDTHSEPVPYRALYKYKPQNDDELELLEGDTVYVLEKCDDGWYVGSSQRTGAFGTFPGNYVERI